MKNLLVLLLSFVVLNAATAQDDPAKMAKSARKALVSYNIDAVGNSGKLDEARTKIDEALKDATVAADAAAWQTKGEVYSTLMLREMTKMQLDKNYKMVMANPALESFKGFSKAYELGQKKYEKGDALKGLTEIEAQLSNLGVANYQADDFALALESFEAAVKAHDMLVAADQKSAIEDVLNIKYMAALSAQQSKNEAKAMAYYEQLYKAKYAEPAVYDGLFNMKMAAGKSDEALAILAEGRKQFPDDSGLLFAEINHYLKAGKLDELTTRLQKAIEKEPNNVGLYVTLGNVYDNLYQRELEAKNEAKAAEYFELAKKYYTETLSKDDKNVDAIYSLGALYYNKAAVQTKALNALPDNMKPETVRQYDALKASIFALFDQALPFFQRAESLDPNDRNTLIALKEIFAKKDELELSLEFKKRLENIEAGGKNEKAWFQK